MPWVRVGTEAEKRQLAGIAEKAMENLRPISVRSIGSDSTACSCVHRSRAHFGKICGAVRAFGPRACPFQLGTHRKAAAPPGGELDGLVISHTRHWPVELSRVGPSAILGPDVRTPAFATGRLEEFHERTIRDFGPIQVETKDGYFVLGKLGG